jgi:hypothetical protein
MMKDFPFFNSYEFTQDGLAQTVPKYTKIHTIPWLFFHESNGETITKETVDSKIYVAISFYQLW